MLIAQKIGYTNETCWCYKVGRPLQHKEGQGIV